jgi:hypothetical protein
VWAHPVGSAAYQAGQIGNALTLGSGKYLLADRHQIASTRLYPIAGNPWTVAGWLKTTGTGTLIASAVADTLHRDFQIALSSGGRFDFYLRGAITSLDEDFNDNTFHHVAVAWDGGTARIYVDGILRFSGAGVGSSPEDTGEVITIGARTGGTGFVLTDGAIDDVRIYARALDPAAVQVLFTLVEDEPGDVTAPSIPGGLTIVQVDSETLFLDWAASTDDSGEPLLYRVYACTGEACSGFFQVATTSASQFPATELTSGLLYRFRVTAVDPSGNESAPSNIVEALVLPAVRRAERSGGSVSGGFHQ